MNRTKISNLEQLHDGDKVMFAFTEGETVRDAAAAVLADGRVYLCQNVTRDPGIKPALRHGYRRALLVRDPHPEPDTRPEVARVLGLVRLSGPAAVPVPVTMPVPTPVYARALEVSTAPTVW